MHDRVRSVVMTYCERFSFATKEVLSIIETEQQQFLVTLRMIHSPSDIQRLSEDPDPVNATEKRKFLSEPFHLRVVATAETVISHEWDMIELC